MAMTLITTNAETNATTSSFTSSIDSTYKLYIFKFIDINPAADGDSFTFQANASGQSGYNELMTTTYFRANHKEDDSAAEGPIYQGGGFDQADGTAFQTLNGSTGNGADESCAGTLWLFNPSNTTYVKHFYSTVSSYQGDQIRHSHMAGYFNFTAALTDVQFKWAGGNFDGTIKMYGVG